MIPSILVGAGIAASAAETVITTESVRPNAIFTALSVMAMNETSAIATLIEIGVMDGTRQIPIDSTPGNFPAKTSHTIYWPSMLREGQRFYAKFLTPSEGDHLIISAHGFYEVEDHERP
ncbi:MAG TPA: hypothetical protein PL124_10315 [Candidatus Cloacimonadota bacterium]|nr:hypothetical protein [Candidatus Cloacimonadota bacterium]